MNGSTGPVVVACLRHSAPRPDVDPLTGTVRRSSHGAGPAPAELAALELALRLAEAWHGQALAIVAGPPAADETLRDALAASIAAAIRVTLAPAPAHPAPAPAAPALGRLGLLLCGDRSADRGTGALPAFLAHELGVAQALGLVSLDAAGETLTAERRLPGGRRERLAFGRPAVCSVEAAGIRLRRAPLEAVLASRRVVIPVAGAPDRAPLRVRAGAARPYLPRPHEVPPPPAGSARERLAALSGVLVTRDPPQLIGPVGPAQAAQALLDYLRRAGYAQDGS